MIVRDLPEAVTWLGRAAHATGRWVSRVRDRLPPWLRSVRTRLALVYSIVLFALAALVVGGLYIGVRASIRNQPVSDQIAIHKHIRGPDGRWRPVRFVLADYRDFERAVNGRTLEQLRRLAFGSLAGLFVGSLGVGWFISGRVLRPIDRITAVTNDIQANDLSRRIRLTGPEDELKRLADTFDEMLGRLEGAFSSQRRFLADASHELRNPLATIRTNLDLVGDAPDPEERARLVGAARRAAQRMTRLVDDLLVLAREGTPLVRRERIDIAQAVQHVTEEFEATATQRGIELVDRSAPGVLATADPEALRRMVANLLDNALRVSPGGSTVVVAAGRQDGWAWLAVSDEGPGLEPSHAERAFDRFWRADYARSRDGGGAGLGLAIVRQIAEAHGGQARVHAEVGGGSIFIVWLPAADDAGAMPLDAPPALHGRPGATA